MLPQFFDRREMLRLLAVQGVVASLPCWASADDAEVPLSDEYARRRRLEQGPSVGLGADIERTLPGLELCWLVPPHTLLVQRKQSRWNYLRAGEFAFRSASLESQLSPEQVDKASRQFPDVVCSQTETWFAYRTAHSVGDKVKVLAMPSVPKGVTVGAYRGDVRGDVLSKDYPVVAGLRQRTEALLSADKRHRLVLHARYASESNELRELGVGLYSGDWAAIARERWSQAPGAGWCDGCNVPTFDDGLEAVFGYFNMLAHSEFAHPLLVLDLSTIESRTLELSTFVEGGHLARVPRTQYVIGCPSFQALLEGNDSHNVAEATREAEGAAGNKR